MSLPLRNDHEQLMNRSRTVLELGSWTVHESSSTGSWTIHECAWTENGQFMKLQVHELFMNLNFTKCPWTVHELKFHMFLNSSWTNTIATVLEQFMNQYITTVLEQFMNIHELLIQFKLVHHHSWTYSWTMMNKFSLEWFMSS